MKRRPLLSVLCFTVLSFISVKAQNIEIFSHKNHFGVLKDGKELIKPKYKSISPLVEGMKYFIVEGNKGYGVIGIDGKTLIPEDYESLEYFDENTFVARKKDKWGLINYLNYSITPFEYTKISAIKDGIAEIWDGSKVGYLSKYGVIIIPPIYDKIEQFTPTTYLVVQDGKYGIINGLGDVLVDTEYDSISLNSDLRYIDVIKDKRRGIMNSVFEIVVEPLYDEIEISDVGLSLIKDNKIGFYTSNGQIIAPKYDKIVFTQPEFGLAVIKTGDKLGFVTATGSVVSPVFENISRFSDRGIAFVEKDGKLMAIDTFGKEMTVQQMMDNKPSLQQGSVYPF